MVTTLERLTKVETKVGILVNSNSDEHRSINKKLDSFIEAADKRYASKLTEKVVYGLVGMIITLVGAALITGVVQAFHP